ncbi:pyrroloquinoline quinone-dependent dehydrogenase [Parvibaculum sedimenti]|nr:pyrroloquinoline quinone-dependent dehydrogenase [Parvibaculum sedimenti]
MRKFAGWMGLGAAFLFYGAFGARSEEWDHYGGDAGGQRHVEADAITPANVGGLGEAWRFQTGELVDKSDEVKKRYAFEGTPILVGGSLIFCTPFNRIIALDPATGAQRWSYDPHVALDRKPGNQYVCRGVAYWEVAKASADRACATRIFMGTVDGRLIALDARSGKPCTGFGRDMAKLGIVDAGADRALVWPGEFQMTSPPVVARDTVIVGSSISDNRRVDAPKGTVRAFDARTGALKWGFDPVARGSAEKPGSWPAGAAEHTGQANVWAPISVDETRGLVFLPTSSPSPDFFGGLRKGNNDYADSVVALKAETGEVVWSFQTVHHDVWDYDLPAQPTLATLTRDDKPVDVVIQVTKTGFMFVLERDTGKPFFGVEERPVPQSAVAGEALSPTQPFPVKPPALVPQKLEKGGAWGVAWFDKRACNAKLDRVRSDGLFTPPSTQGTLIYPFTGGGANWGGMSFDPVRKIAIINVNRAGHIVTLFPAAEYRARRAADLKAEISPQEGAPYGMERDLFLSPLGLPCTPPPWGTLVAVDLNDGTIKWNHPFGTIRDLAPVPLPLEWGVPNCGGPLTTKTGLVFIGATMDNYLRAFDIESGKELWKGRLPAGGQATPMSYAWKGRQYVVIAAGGHARSGTKLGDYVIAYALPDAK